MKLRDLLGHENFQQMLEDMLEPDTTKPPREKGPDAIKVNGYVVHGFWRRRWREVRVSENVTVRRRRRARPLTPSELEAEQRK